jgi:ribosomal protein L35AE/L33A
MVGLRVGWPADVPKIYGKIVGIHGRKGVLRVRFKRGLPGQALSTNVKIMRKRASASM